MDLSEVISTEYAPADRLGVFGQGVAFTCCKDGVPFLRQTGSGCFCPQLRMSLRTALLPYLTIISQSKKYPAYYV